MHTSHHCIRLLSGWVIMLIWMKSQMMMIVLIKVCLGLANDSQYMAKMYQDQKSDDGTI